MTRLLLVRHGESTWNAASRWQGQADPPLSSFGERQAEDATVRLSQIATIVAVWTSDLVRARRTGELIAERLGLGGVRAESRLRERDVGSLGATPERLPNLGGRWLNAASSSDFTLGDRVVLLEPDEVTAPGGPSEQDPVSPTG